MLAVEAECHEEDEGTEEDDSSHCTSHYRQQVRLEGAGGWGEEERRGGGRRGERSGGREGRRGGEGR